MSSWPESDLEAMRAALALAEQGEAAGEVPVGAVVVIDGDIVAGAHNRTLSDNDPAGHAEIVALRDAASKVGNHRLPPATLYVTLEPCAMCVGAIAQARVARVVFGAYDEKAGACGSAIDLTESAALNHRFEVNGGVLAGDSGVLLARFFAVRR